MCQEKPGGRGRKKTHPRYVLGRGVWMGVTGGKVDRCLAIMCSRGKEGDGS